LGAQAPRRLALSDDVIDVVVGVGLAPPPAQSPVGPKSVEGVAAAQDAVSTRIVAPRPCGVAEYYQEATSGPVAHGFTPATCGTTLTWPAVEFAFGPSALAVLLRAPPSRQRPPPGRAKAGRPQVRSERRAGSGALATAVLTQGPALRSPSDGSGAVLPFDGTAPAGGRLRPL
jgi:hypothetical protein